ncbi:MAG: nuclear transport factor 2 family protein [Caulobacter sp.]
MAKAEVLLTRHFDATRRRDIEAVAAGLHPEIAFVNVLEGGDVAGLDAARGYFEHQFAMVGVDISLMRLRPQADGWVHADVEITLRRPDGRLWSQNMAVIAYLLRDGLIVGIDPQPDPGTR